MGPLALGALALVAVLFLLRLLVGADARVLAKALRYFIAVVLIGAAVGLAAMDRVGLAMLAASTAWGFFSGGHIWPGNWPPSFGGRPRHAKTPPSSTVTTDWLEMELDHVTGEMRGRVLRGQCAGSTLDALTGQLLSGVWREVSARDPESVALLEAYLERRFGADWRNQSGFASRTTPNGMSREEALAVLGLSSGAGEEEIRAAHRKLILNNHPDRGGSSYLAAKINEAKDVLLGG
jgi:hypothetical protein